jgi:hypothetical protein
VCWHTRNVLARGISTAAVGTVSLFVTLLVVRRPDADAPEPQTVRPTAERPPARAMESRGASRGQRGCRTCRLHEACRSRCAASSNATQAFSVARNDRFDRQVVTDLRSAGEFRRDQDRV